MMRVIKDNNNCYDGDLKSHQIVKIQNGVKEGFKIHLNGPNGQNNDASIEGPKGHNYVITPAGAPVGENIAINEHGLYIRARNNKKQLITATSCPDNQVKVQVGQGKSAVQLSIQVAPQGKRGEVELNCSRNETENGGTGYTVSVNRDTQDSKACAGILKQQHVATPTGSNYNNEKLSNQKATAAVAASPSPNSPSACDVKEDTVNKSTTAAPCQNIPSAVYPGSNSHHTHFSNNGDCLGLHPTLSATPPIRNCHESLCKPFSWGGSPVVERHEHDAAFDLDVEAEQRVFSGNARNNEQLYYASLSDKIKHANALEKLYRERELLLSAELERFMNANYKRKLDLHHHKPTISYLIGRRMTALFKEMRKTSELHPPCPPFVKF